MFRKLKDKIAEEVKSSPQRIQQLTQSVTERIQNATSDESFFSIGDDDAPSSSPNPEPGFSNVSLSSYSTPNSGRLRRNSNSSVASDMSFLPRYESATNLYHLQSDLDASASEVEDNASTSSQLGHLSKEQIYAAFQKAQMRYHKYRGRYTDIANHYKELERENGKMKSVLVETQDKALRRVAELREQCSLEQKAKAHLENALRVELDEKQYVIDTLKTKVNLLQTSIKNGDTGKPELLVNINDNSFSISDDPSEKAQNDNLDVLTKDLKDARVEIENLNEKLQEMKANSIIFNSKESDLKKRISELEEVNKQKTQEISQILERERENNLIIAQTKMELHTEIQNRDLEIENLKYDVESLKADLDQYESKPKSSTKLENLQSQNAKLIDKVEELTQKCNNYESDLLKTEQLKIELQNSSKAIESFKARVQELEKEEKLQQMEAVKSSLEEIESSRQELEAVKLRNEGLHGEIEKLKGTLEMHEKTTEDGQKLQEEIKQLQTDYEEKIAAYREDTKKRLLTLETKIRDKMKVEYDDKEKALTVDFQEKFQQLSKSDNNVKQTQLKLLETEEEVKSLRKTMGNLEETLQNQQDKYKDLETNHLDLIAESTDVRNALAQSQKQLNELEEQLLRQKNETGAFISATTSLERNYAVLQHEIQSIQNEKNAFESKTSNLQSENTNLHQENTNLQNGNATLLEDKSKLEDEVSNLQLSLSSASLLNSELQEHINKLSQASETTQQELNEKLSEIRLLQEKISRHENEIQDTSNDSAKELTILREELGQTLALLEKTNRNLEETHETKENLQQMLERAKQGFQKKLKEQRTKFHGEIQALNSEILGFKEKNGMIQTSIDEYKQKLNQYESDTLEKSTRLQDVGNDNVALREEVERLKKLLDETNRERVEFSKNISRLEGEVLQKTTEALSVQNRLDQFKNSCQVEVVSLNEQLQKTLDENNNLKEQIVVLQADASKNLNEVALDNESLKQKLVKLESDHEMISGGNKELKGQVVRLQESEMSYKTRLTNLEAVEGDYKSLQKDNAEFQTKIDDLNAEKQRLQNDIAQLHDRVRTHDEILIESHQTKENYSRSLEEVSELERRNNELTLDYKQISQENEGLFQELAEIKLKYETLEAEKSKWDGLLQSSESEKREIQSELQQHLGELEKLKLENPKTQDQQDTDAIITENKSLKMQLSRLEERVETYEKQKKSLEGQLRELENQYTEISHEKQLLQDEIQELKISPINMSNHTSNAQKLENLDMIHAEKILSLERPGDVKKLQDDHEKEIHQLNEKLVQYKSLDLTNRSSIQFYENELQKLKNKNEKLNRKLDETLVTLHHCAELSHSTETEYLKNVLYNYMLGKEGLVLARVIAAVCKFDDTQTEAILQREQQKQTLFGQLGFI